MKVDHQNKSPVKKSAAGQDDWILETVFPSKRKGFFVDLGAADGMLRSNTYRLEKERGWVGLCIEANPDYFSKLEESRRCTCINSCVDYKRHTVDFIMAGEIGGIVDVDTDNSPEKQAEKINCLKKQGKLIRLPTIPLWEIFEEFSAPASIDYLSIDIEGSETRALKQFPFDTYCFLSATIERPTQELQKILAANHYRYIKRQRQDFFYLHESIADLVITNTPQPWLYHFEHTPLLRRILNNFIPSLDVPPTLVETGAGRTTKVIAEYSRSSNGHFFSCDVNQQKIDKLRSDPSCSDVTFLAGNSTEKLRDLTKKIDHVDFAFLDSYPSALHTFEEFQILEPLMELPGSILVIDNASLPGQSHQLTGCRKGKILVPYLLASPYWLVTTHPHDGGSMIVAVRQREPDFSDPSYEHP